MSAPLAAGVWMFAAAAMGDVVAHALALTAIQTPAHVATLAGMVATLAAVVSDGISRHRHPRPEKETHHAVR